MTVLEHINPASLTIDANVRADVQLDKTFLASIKEHGVLQPVVAHCTEDGGVRVLYGQRRTLAAVETAQPLIPVYVVDSLTEADRLAKQVVENDHRQALTDHDRAEAFHQLSLLGVSASQIARKTGAKKTTVETALKVRANDTATKALAGGWTLEQSAALEEFSDDTDALASLQEALNEYPDRFDHTVQYLRNERENARLVTEATAEQVKAGKTVVEAAGYQMPEHQYPHALLRADGKPATDEDTNAVVLTVTYRNDINVRPVIANWEANGFTLQEYYGGPSSTQSGPMTEEQKEERRRVIKNNKLWDAATEVRHQWLTTLLSRKNPPKDWAKFTATTLASYGNSVAKATAQKQDLAAGFAGVPEPGYRSYKELTEKTTTNPNVVVLAMMLAAHESDLSRDSWRRPGTQAAYYLFQLQDWGYTLSEVETIITDHTLARDAQTIETQEAPEEPGETFEDVHAGEEELIAEEDPYAEAL